MSYFMAASKPMFFTVCLFAIISIVPGVSARGNLIENPGFEIGDSNSSSGAADWDAIGSGGYAVARDSLDPHTGTYDELLTTPGEASGYSSAGVTQTLPTGSIIPGKQYYVSLFLEGPSSAYSLLTVQWNDSSGTPLGGGGFGPPFGNDPDSYSQFQGSDITAPANASSATILIWGVPNSATSEVRIDDIFFDEVPEPASALSSLTVFAMAGVRAGRMRRQPM